MPSVAETCQKSAHSWHATAMNSRFWDDDEESVKIGYEDDQLAPVRAPLDGPDARTAAGDSIVLT